MAKPDPPPKASTWRSRIVGSADVDPATLVANPRNWRTHPPNQRAAINGLDEEIRARILPLSKPYPKRAASIASDAPGLQPGEGGSTPTAALQFAGTA
jgi:hypothetical protein